MYTITLEVNQICNLRCTYCYLGRKTNQKMSEQIAYKGLEIAFLNAENHRDRRLWVDFVGGEALLSFPFLKQLVEYIEGQALKRKKAGKAFLWGPILDLKKYGENNGESGFCGVGLIQIYIKVDGRIFGCAANLEDSGCIGDVENGLSKECIKRLRKIGKEGNMCSKCSFAVKCQSKNCIMNSLAYSGTVGEHNPDMCYFERKKRNLWEIYAPQL